MWQPNDWAQCERAERARRCHHSRARGFPRQGLMVDPVSRLASAQSAVSTVPAEFEPERDHRLASPIAPIRRLRSMPSGSGTHAPAIPLTADDTMLGAACRRKPVEDVTNSLVNLRAHWVACGTC